MPTGQMREVWEGYMGCEYLLLVSPAPPHPSRIIRV